MLSGSEVSANFIPEDPRRIGSFGEPHMCQSGFRISIKDAKNAEFFHHMRAFTGTAKDDYCDNRQGADRKFLAVTALAPSSRDMYPCWMEGVGIKASHIRQIRVQNACAIRLGQVSIRQSSKVGAFWLFTRNFE